MNCIACDSLIDPFCCHLIGKYRVYYYPNYTYVWTDGIEFALLSFKKPVLLDSISRIEKLLVLK
jgi:hypothetical protein